MTMHAETVLQIIADEMAMSSADLPRQARLHELGIDSLRLLELGMNIEERLQITIDDRAFSTFQSIDDIIAFVEANCAAGPQSSRSSA